MPKVAPVGVSMNTIFQSQFHMSSNHFASLQTKKDKYIHQHFANVYSVIGMLDFEHSDCVQCLYGVPDCTDRIGFQTPLSICIPSLLGKSAQGNGKSLVIFIMYQGIQFVFSFGIKFLTCLCSESGWSQYMSIYSISTYINIVISYIHSVVYLCDWVVYKHGLACHVQ